MKAQTFVAAVAALALSSGAFAAKKELFARTELQPKSGTKTTGTVEFFKEGKNVVVEAKVAGGTAGEHGIHVHEKGDCSAADAASAGGHFNPTNHTHAGPADKVHHVGDFGNLTLDKDGNGSLTLTVKGEDAKVLLDQVVGKSVVVHEKLDDLKTQPSGNSGSRVACGVVAKAPNPTR